MRNLVEDCKQLARLARQKCAWVIEFRPERPIHWSPGSVTDPRTGAPFTEAGAKQLVAELAERGPLPSVVILEKPPGSTAFVWTVPGVRNETIYIKVQLGSGKIIGRSFHLSERRCTGE